MISPVVLIRHVFPLAILIVLFFIIKDKNSSKTDNLFNVVVSQANGLFILRVVYRLIIAMSADQVMIYEDKIGPVHILPFFLMLLCCGLLVYVQKKKGVALFKNILQRSLFLFTFLFFANCVFTLYFYRGAAIEIFNAIIILIVSFMALGKKNKIAHRFLVSTFIGLVFIAIQQIITSCSITLQFMLPMSVPLDVINSMYEILTVISMVVASLYCIAFIYITRKGDDSVGA